MIWAVKDWVTHDWTAYNDVSCLFPPGGEFWVNIMSDSPVSNHGSVEEREPVGHQEDLNRGMPPVSPARASPAAEQDEGQMDAQGASRTPDRPGQGRPDHDVDAGPTGDQRQQELEEVDADMTLIMQRTDLGDRTHSSRDELQGAMSHRDGELRTEDTGCEELRSFAVGLMPHPVLSRATSRVTTLQEMGAGSSGEAEMVHGRTDTGPGSVMDQMFATIQLQLQQTQQLVASMEQQRKQQETLAKLLAQQAHVRRLMCEIMRGLVHCNGSTASVKGRRVKQRDMETMMKKLDQLTQQLHQPQLLPSNGQSQATDDGASGTTTGSSQLRSPGAAKGERKCWLCGARGDNFHLSSDCPNGWERSCYTCGAKGPDFHLSRSCPQHQGNRQLLA